MSTVLKLFKCKYDHTWEAEDEEDNANTRICPVCGERAVAIEASSEEKTLEGSIASGESGMASDPDPYGKKDE